MTAMLEVILLMSVIVALAIAQDIYRERRGKRDTSALDT
jgi:hypothetical protein